MIDTRPSGVRSTRWWIGWLLVLAVGLALALVPIPWTVFSPRAPQTVETMLHVEGAARPLSGNLLAASVGYRQATPALALWALLDPSRAVVRDPDDARQRPVTGASQAFDDSVMASAVAALELLGRPVAVSGEGLQVALLASERGVADVLQVGDVLLEADGMPLVLPSDLRTVAARAVDGGTISMRLMRDGRTLEVDVPVEFPDPDRRRLEVTTVQVAPSLELPDGLDVSGLDPDAQGGSAGMLLAVAIVDRLGDEPLLDGRRVAGTGSIDRAGNVYGIDGMAQKVRSAAGAGAELFLAPAEQLDAARAAAPEDLEVIGVATVAEAVDALRS